MRDQTPACCGTNPLAEPWRRAGAGSQSVRDARSSPLQLKRFRVKSIDGSETTHIFAQERLSFRHEPPSCLLAARAGRARSAAGRTRGDG